MNIKIKKIYICYYCYITVFISFPSVFVSWHGLYETSPLPPLMCFVHLNSMNTVFSKYMLEEGYSMLITCTFFLIFRNIYIHQLNSCCIYHFLHIPVERNAPLKCLKMRRASDPWGEGKLTRKQSFWSQTPYGTPFWLIYDLRWVIPNIITSHHVTLVDITMSRHFRQRSMQ